jgi:hypothetical protein
MRRRCDAPDHSAAPAPRGGPRGRRAADERDELAALQRRDHWITSRTSRVAGTSKPSALAVFKLRTVSFAILS